MLMVMAQDKKEYVRTQLLKKAQEQGVVTYDDILALLPEAERDIALLDDLMDSLVEAGIEVVPNSSAEPSIPGHELIPVDVNGNFPDEDDEEFALLEIDDDLTDDAGYQQALDTDDVVGLYLKEAGRVPLLTATDEVSLAKRMEAGLLAKQQLEEYEDDLPMDDAYTLRELVADGEDAQEHLVRCVRGVGLVLVDEAQDLDDHRIKLAYRSQFIRDFTDQCAI